MSTSILEPPVKTDSPDASAVTEAQPAAVEQAEQAGYDSPISYELLGESEFAAAAAAPRPRWRRRRYIVDWRFQLKMSLMTGVFVLIPSRHSTCSVSSMATPRSRRSSRRRRSSPRGWLVRIASGPCRY